MNTKPDLKLQLARLTPVALLALIRNVVAKMTGSTLFVDPYVPLADMTLKADALEVLIELATDGSRSSKSRRNDLIVHCSEMLRSQASYVRSICVGDLTKLLQSGFELAKVPERIGMPGTPLFKMTKMTGREGEVVLRWSAQRGAAGYHVWMTDKDPALNDCWVATGLTMKATHVVNHLESYKAYWFAVSAFGTAGEGVRSNPTLVRAA